MKFDKEPLDKELLERLGNHHVFLSSNCPPVNREKALVLLAEAIFNEFVQKFSQLWKKELFPSCLLRDYAATDKEMHDWIHGGD